MAKKGPRVPLPATIKLPGIERTIQVNHCKMPNCSNFGIPARTRRAKPGPSRGRDPYYKVHSTKAGTVPSVRCKACKDNPPVKSNACIAQEVERLTEESGIWSLLESTSCGNTECGNHGRPIAFHPDEYRKRGKPPSGTGHYYQCKDCGRRTLVSDPIRLHDNNRRYAVDVLGRIANKAPVRGSYRGAKLKSPQAYYDIVKFLHRRCRNYSGSVDRALIDGRLRLPADLNVQSDAQVYLWGANSYSAPQTSSDRNSHPTGRSTLDEAPDRGTTEVRHMGGRVGHAPAPDPERSAKGHVLV